MTCLVIISRWFYKWGVGYRCKDILSYLLWSVAGRILSLFWLYLKFRAHIIYTAKDSVLSGVILIRGESR